MVMSKTGKKTEPEEEFSIKLAPPDGPFYTRGYVIGGYYSSRSSKTTSETASEQKNEPLSIGERYRRAGIELLKKSLEKKGQ